MCKHRDLIRVKLYYISEVLKKSFWPENPGKNFIFDHQLTPIGLFLDKLTSSGFISAETLLNAVKQFKIYFSKLFMQYYADILLSQTFRSVKYKTENDKKYFELFSFILFISK